MFTQDLNLPYQQHSEADTLILTAVVAKQGSATSGDAVTSAQRSRELCFQNIIKHLKERGVSLRRQYPEVYAKLSAYVERNEPFQPITIYPKDGRTGKTFTCSIMPNCDSELKQIFSTTGSKSK